MNIVLGIISIILCFGTIVILDKFFKKEGLYIWISIATIIANILVCKTINILGFTSSLGNIMFASVFLATDIMTEKYGGEHSKKAIFPKRNVRPEMKMMRLCNSALIVAVTETGCILRMEPFGNSGVFTKFAITPSACPSAVMDQWQGTHSI